VQPTRASLRATCYPISRRSLASRGGTLALNLVCPRFGREGLVAQVSAEARRPVGLNGAERAELALVRERLTQLRRREVAAERLRPTKLIAESLGPRPKEPLKAALWNESVDLIYGYRQRNGITATGGHPLGPKPREAARRRERQQAERRLARIQKRLGKQRAKSAERPMRLFR